MTASLARNSGTAPSAPAARPKGRIRQQNEENILRAAEAVFARAGFAGARVAEIAAEAGIPKPNLHYYFKSKRALYRAVLHNILTLWLAETDIIREDVEPRAALEQYLRAKMKFSRLYPNASKVFANEIIHGAGEIGPYLRSELRRLVAAKTRVFEHWMRAGRMIPLDPKHLFFAIWAITQTYADFEAQVRAVLGVSELSEAQYRRATEQVIGLILRGCGYYYAQPAEPAE